MGEDLSPNYVINPLGSLGVNCDLKQKLRSPGPHKILLVSIWESLNKIATNTHTHTHLSFNLLPPHASHQWLQILTLKTTRPRHPSSPNCTTQPFAHVYCIPHPHFKRFTLLCHLRVYYCHDKGRGEIPSRPTPADIFSQLAHATLRVVAVQGCLPVQGSFCPCCHPHSLAQPVMPCHALFSEEAQGSEEGVDLRARQIWLLSSAIY